MFLYQKLIMSAAEAGSVEKLDYAAMEKSLYVPTYKSSSSATSSAGSVGSVEERIKPASEMSFQEKVINGVVNEMEGHYIALKNDLQVALSGNIDTARSTIVEGLMAEVLEVTTGVQKVLLDRMDKMEARFPANVLQGEVVDNNDTAVNLLSDMDKMKVFLDRMDKMESKIRFWLIIGFVVMTMAFLGMTVALNPVTLLVNVTTNVTSQCPMKGPVMNEMEQCLVHPVTELFRDSVTARATLVDFRPMFESLNKTETINMKGVPEPTTNAQMIFLGVMGTSALAKPVALLFSVAIAFICG